MPFVIIAALGGCFEITATDDDGIFCDDPVASLSAETSKIDRSTPIVAETEQIPNRRNSPLNSRAQISDG
jgi:hypothetical protein